MKGRELDLTQDNEYCRAVVYTALNIRVQAVHEGFCFTDAVG